MFHIFYLELSFLKFIFGAILVKSYSAFGWPGRPILWPLLLGALPDLCVSVSVWLLHTIQHPVHFTLQIKSNFPIAPFQYKTKRSLLNSSYKIFGSWRQKMLLLFPHVRFAFEMTLMGEVIRSLRKWPNQRRLYLQYLDDQVARKVGFFLAVRG